MLYLEFHMLEIGHPQLDSVCNMPSVGNVTVELKLLTWAQVSALSEVSRKRHKFAATIRVIDKVCCSVIILNFHVDGRLCCACNCWIYCKSSGQNSNQSRLTPKRVVWDGSDCPYKTDAWPCQIAPAGGASDFFDYCSRIMVSSCMHCAVPI